jgi:hypothetical protein
MLGQLHAPLRQPTLFPAVLWPILGQDAGDFTMEESGNGLVGCESFPADVLHHSAFHRKRRGTRWWARCTGRARDARVAAVVVVAMWWLRRRACCRCAAHLKHDGGRRADGPGEDLDALADADGRVDERVPAGEVDVAAVRAGPIRAKEVQVTYCARGGPADGGARRGVVALVEEGAVGPVVESGVERRAEVADDVTVHAVAEEEDRGPARYRARGGRGGGASGGGAGAARAVESRWATDARACCGHVVERRAGVPEDGRRKAGGCREILVHGGKHAAEHPALPDVSAVCGNMRGEKLLLQLAAQLFIVEGWEVLEGEVEAWDAPNQARGDKVEEDDDFAAVAFHMEEVDSTMEQVVQGCDFLEKIGWLWCIASCCYVRGKVPTTELIDPTHRLKICDVVEWFLVNVQ